MKIKHGFKVISFFTILGFFAVSLNSCKKSNPATTTIEEVKKPSLEKVSQTLLNNYIDYQSSLEALALRKVDDSTTLKKMNRIEFNSMIENFLANERNQLIQNAINNGSYSINSAVLDTVTVECKGDITGMNSLNTVLFLARVYSDHLFRPSMAFGGFSGTMAPTGDFIQQTYNGVVTYRQYYTETLTGSNGGQYTQLYVFYGNVYNGQGTVHGMRVVNSQ